MRGARLLCLLLAVSATVRGGAAPGVAAVDVRGIHVALPAAPRRIVSLSPANTEILFALGLKGRIVADTTWCDYPPEARVLPKVGDVNISIEKVLAQRPDLIVASHSANRKAVGELERLRQPLFVVDPNDLRQTYSAIEALGKITGQTAQAAHLVQELQRRERGIRAAVARDRSRPAVLILVQTDPPMVAGSANFMDDLVTAAGGRNAAADAGSGFHTYPLEKIMARAPDVILADRGSVQALRSRPGWSALPAVKRGAVYALGLEAARPGPRLVEVLERLARTLHPRAFPARR